MLCGVPDKILANWLKGKGYIVASDEGESIGIGIGYYLATGKRATVFFSADGFCNAMNPLTSLVIPDGIPMNLVIGSGRQEPAHKVMSDNLEFILKILNYDDTRIHIKIIKE